MSLSVGNSQGGSYLPPNEEIGRSRQDRTLIDKMVENKQKKNLWKEIRDQDTALAEEQAVRETKKSRERNNDLMGEQTRQKVRMDDTP